MLDQPTDVYADESALCIEFLVAASQEVLTEGGGFGGFDHTQPPSLGELTLLWNTLLRPVPHELRGFVPETRFFFIRERGRLIGSVQLLREPPVRTALRHRGKVAMMFVRPSHRGRGYGRRLLSDLIRAAREQSVTHLELWVRVTQPYAHALYVAAGFQETHREPAYARIDGKNIEGIHMRLELEKARAL